MSAAPWLIVSVLRWNGGGVGPRGLSRLWGKAWRSVHEVLLRLLGEFLGGPMISILAAFGGTHLAIWVNCIEI